jgi:FKBP-type peptidyl-prolyl cis-trans isomerase FklB
MNMKMNWIVLASLGLVGFQANAEQAAVIDSQMIGMLDNSHAKSTNVTVASAAETNTSAPTEAQAALAEANRVNKERVLKAHNLSGKQSVALAKEKLSENNVQAGETFLLANKAKPGVISLPSGVQYKVLRAGKGKKPTEAGAISCRYVGKLVDGSSFEKSDAPKPTWLNVTGFVPGLKEAIKMMSAGAKWEIVVPPNLAYGPAGNRGIGGNAVVIYTMEIVGVK